MKSYSKIIILLILFLILQVLAFCADYTPKGNYVPNIVLTAPWGEKNLRVDKVQSEPGKIGFKLSSEGLECGPTAFTVAPNGDIYIGDIINDRVQRFSSNGSFLTIIPNIRVGADVGMRVDKEGNIYMGHFYTLDPYVKKYDLQGNLVITYHIAKDEDMGTDDPGHWGGQGNILVDDSGKVFVQYLKGGNEYSF